MSDSELSDVPEDIDDHDIHEDDSNDGAFSSSSLSLPPSSSATLQLPVTHSTLFTKNLYSRTILRGRPNKMQYACMQEGCSYMPEARPLSQNTTSNLWRHIELKHPTVFNASSKSSRKQKDKDDVRPQNRASLATFFKPNPRGKPLVSSTKFRELLLAFIVMNNLPMRLVDKFSFRQLVHHLNPSALSISSTSLKRDLHRQFCHHRGQLELQLRNHIKAGGRLSLTTDAWTAMNGTDHAAVTVHWISQDWVQHSRLLDVINLLEPIHSGEYLAQELLSVTDDFKITSGVFTITRDNASNNTAMLSQYEIGAADTPTTTNQPWSFSVKDGDVRCMAHIINLAVQAALTTMKAVLSKELESY